MDTVITSAIGIFWTWIMLGVCIFIAVAICLSIRAAERSTLRLLRDFQERIAGELNELGAIVKGPEISQGSRDDFKDIRLNFEKFSRLTVSAESIALNIEGVNELKSRIDDAFHTLWSQINHEIAIADSKRDFTKTAIDNFSDRVERLEQMLSDNGGNAEAKALLQSAKDCYAEVVERSRSSDMDWLVFYPVVQEARELLRRAEALIERGSVAASLLE